MRPKSALFYIDDLDEIMDQFIMRVEGTETSNMPTIYIGTFHTVR